MKLLRWLQITEDQWFYVLFFTVYVCLAAQSHWGWATFPLWYAIALLGKHTP